MPGTIEQTKLIYLTDAYVAETQATIAQVETKEKQAQIILDATIFYPQGGGQPADTGLITGPNGSMQVTHVSYNGGLVLHKGSITGKLQAGDSVTLSIDWDRRHTHMKLHTAGHIIDQAIKNCTTNNFGIDGDHGIGKHARITLQQPISTALLAQIETEANAIIARNLPITAEMIAATEITERNIVLQFALPTNKDLRIVTIGKYAPMPDGGTHLRSTGECPTITIQQPDVVGETSTVTYSLVAAQSTPQPDTKSEKVSTATLTELNDNIAKLKQEFLSETETAVETLKTKYLGKKGSFNTLAKYLATVPTSDKKTAGELLNALKKELTEHINNRSLEGATPTWVDLTMPGKLPKIGHVHPVSQAMAEITTIFEKIGFQRARYPEVDWDWYVFESLNMPPNHPARDEWETFFIDKPDTTNPTVAYDSTNPRQRHPDLIGGKIVLTTHTSNGQVREMERLESKPPIRMINIARCYRRQQDATHTQMFHQFEGLVVDEGITIQHLKGTLDHFAQEFYGEGTRSRIRPFHFQFTEPSFEVDFSCHLCHATGVINGEKCKFCKSGWHEVGGAGMVHPNVLKAGGIDPDRYTGFAFGWGVERTYTLKEGLNIDDIRLLYSGDLAFLEQF